jgi:hypothetical protein
LVKEINVYDIIFDVCCAYIMSIGVGLYLISFQNKIIQLGNCQYEKSYE